MKQLAEWKDNQQNEKIPESYASDKNSKETTTTKQSTWEMGKWSE